MNDDNPGALIGFIRRWGPTLLVVVLIFLLSSIPSRQIPRFGAVDLLVKKGAHAFGYGLLAAALWYGLRWKKRLWWLALVLAALYAATDELHQSFVPGRHPSPVDVGIDSAGAAISIAICAFVKVARRKQT